MQTLLQIVQNFCKRSGLPVPVTVVGSPDQRVTQIQALLEEVGQFLVSEFNFEALKRDAVFFALSTESQGPVTQLLGSEGSSYSHIVPNTMWNRTLRRKVFGGMSDQRYQAQKSYLNSGLIANYRLANQNLLLWPPAPQGSVFGFTWICKNWIIQSGGNGYTFAADADTPVFNDTLLQIGLRAAWMREKGQPYADLMQDFIARAENEAGRSNAAQTLKMDQDNADLFNPMGVPAIGSGSNQPYDTTLFWPGTIPSINYVLMSVPLDRAITYPNNLSSSYAVARTAATNSCTINIQKNNVTVATVTFAAGSTVGTFSCPSGFTMNQGDVLAIIGPSTVDPTLANIGIVISGIRN